MRRLVARIILSVMLLIGLSSISIGEEVLLFDEFAGPFDTQTTWKADQVPRCEDSAVFIGGSKSFSSRKFFSEPVSVSFEKVSLAQPLCSSDNNNIGITPGYADNMLFFRFSHGKMFAGRRFQGKEYGEPDKESGWGTFAGEIAKKEDGAASIPYDLRIDWWPDRLVRYYLNDKLVAEYTDHVMATPSPVGVRDEHASFRIGSIKITKITEDAEALLKEAAWARKKAESDREQMIAEYYELRKSAGLQTPPQFTPDPDALQFTGGEYVNVASIGALFNSIGFVPDATENFFFIHLSDVHIFTGEPEELTTLGNTAEALLICLKEINALKPRPAFVIITGDLACGDGETKAYQRLKEIMKSLNPDIDTFYLLGNHDTIVSNFKAVFPDRPIDYSFDRGKWHFIALFDRGNGDIDREQYFWLKNDLKNNKETPTVLFNHHPLYLGWPKEEMRPLREKIFHLIKTHQNLRWIFSGHWHGNYLVQCKYDGIPLVNLATCPSATIRGLYCDAGTYRIVCVARSKVQATICKKVGDNGFRIDPPPEEWPIYFPPPLDYYKYMRMWEPKK